LKILAIERDKLAINYYRILQPLAKVDELGLAEVQFVEEKNLGDERSKDMALWADVIVFQRPATEAWYNFIKLCRKIGKVIVADYDDHPFKTSPLNPFYRYVGVEPVMWEWADGTKEWLWHEDMVGATGEKLFNIEQNINHRDMFRANFKKADIVTTTTEILREEFLKVNPNVAILPNLICPEFFPSKYEFVKRDVRIGWQGGNSHYEDLYFVVPVIKEVLERNKNAKFVYFGDLRFMGMFKDCPQNQIEWHSWVGHAVYPYKLAMLNLDIGLCPLVDNEFNRNKSSIKWMEYSALKMMTVASNIPPYSVSIDNERTGVLVNEDHKAWVDVLNKAVSDKYYRQHMAQRAYDDVIENHNINTKAHLWVEAYQKAAKGELVGAK